MTPKEFKIKYRVETPDQFSLRLIAAKILVAFIGLILRVRVRPYVDDRKPTRDAEVAPNREMIYRGTPFGETVPDPRYLARTSYPVEVKPNNDPCQTRKCAGCKIPLDPGTLYHLVGHPGDWCRACALGFPSLDPEPNIEATYRRAWENLEAKAKLALDPSPQSHVRCQVCDYPTFKLTLINGVETCGWCAIKAPIAETN